MAWSEQCKFAFKANAEAKLGKHKNQGKRTLKAILMELSEESGIPYKTLRRWWYEKENEKSPKNGTYYLNSENDSKKDEKTMEEVAERPICYRCQKTPVELKRGKPLPKGTMYYGLCSACRKKQLRISQIDRDADRDEKFMTICPNCNHVHYVSKERLEIMVKKFFRGGTKK